LAKLDKSVYYIGIGLVRMVLDSRLKKHLNHFNGSGDTVEFLLNSGSVQQLLRGNDTQLKNLRKTVKIPGIQVTSTLNGKDLIKNVQVNIEQSRKENKLDSFLNSLKAALQDINRNITKGTYLRIFWNSSIFVYMFKFGLPYTHFVFDEFFTFLIKSWKQIIRWSYQKRNIL